MVMAHWRRRGPARAWYATDAALGLVPLCGPSKLRDVAICAPYSSARMTDDKDAALREERTDGSELASNSRARSSRQAWTFANNRRSPTGGRVARCPIGIDRHCSRHRRVACGGSGIAARRFRSGSRWWWHRCRASVSPVINQRGSVREGGRRTASGSRDARADVTRSMWGKPGLARLRT